MYLAWVSPGKNNEIRWEAHLVDKVQFGVTSTLSCSTSVYTFPRETANCGCTLNFNYFQVVQYETVVKLSWLISAQACDTELHILCQVCDISSVNYRRGYVFVYCPHISNWTPNHFRLFHSFKIIYAFNSSTYGSQSHFGQKHLYFISQLWKTYNLIHSFNWISTDMFPLKTNAPIIAAVSNTWGDDITAFFMTVSVWQF